MSTIFDMQEYLLSDIGQLLDSLIIIWKKVDENDWLIVWLIVSLID